MKLPFEFALALRYLRPKRSFVSVITLISIIGVTLGVAVLIIVMSVMSGFAEQLRGKILDVSPHIRVRDGNFPGFPANPPLLTRVDDLKSIPGVLGISPYIQDYTMAEIQGSGDIHYHPVNVLGLDPKDPHLTAKLGENLVDGELFLRGDSVLLGAPLADRTLRARVNDFITLHSPLDLRRMAQSYRDQEENEDGASDDGQIVLAPDEFDVTGIFDMGFWEFDSTTAVVSLYSAQDLLGLGDAIDGLWLTVENPYKVGPLRGKVEEALGPNYAVSSWLSEGGALLDALVVEKAVMFYILFFIMLVAAFGIMGSQIAFVVQKTREIGILKALGANSRQIMALFLGQSAIIGIIGVSAGFVFGILAIQYRNPFLKTMNQLTGFELFPQELYQFSELPALIIPGDIAVICGGAILMCLLAGVAPAWNAGRMRPLDALRHE